MTDDMLILTCTRCDHTWDIRLSEMGAAERIVYKGQIEQRTYRVPCPRCGTYVVAVVEIEEDSDD